MTRGVRRRSGNVGEEACATRAEVRNRADAARRLVRSARRFSQAVLAALGALLLVIWSPFGLPLAASPAIQQAPALGPELPLKELAGTGSDPAAAFDGTN